MVITICFLMNMLDGIDVMVVSYAANAISKDWNISPQSLGIVFSAGLLGMTLGAIFLAPVADKVGRKKLIIISNIIMSVSVFCTAWSPSVEVLMIMRIISGIGIGSMLANVATLASENAPPKQKDLWVSVVMAGYPFGAILSGFAIAYILSHYGWHAVFKLAGIATISLLPVSIFFLKESKEFIQQKEMVRRPPATLLLNDSYRASTLALWVAIFMSFATLYFLTTWIPKLASATGLSDKLAIYAGTIFNLGAFIGIISRGYISRIWRLHSTIIFYLMCTLLLLLFFGLFSNAAIILLLIGIIGFGIQGGFVGMYSMAAILYPAPMRATGVGWAVGIGRIGAIAGPFLGGILVSAGFSMASGFMFFAIPTFISAVAVIFIKLQPK